MKYAQLAMVTFLLTLPIACAHGGVPLSPELQDILDSTPGCPPNCLTLNDIDIVALKQEYGLPTSPPASQTPGNQIKTLTDSHGNYIGQARLDGSSGIWTIVDQSGEYMGRIDNKGIITNSRGEYLGRID